MTTTNDYEYINETSIHEDLLCPLCTDPLVEPLCANQCGHTFCRECITETCRTMSKCPTCRHDLTLNDLHPVNLRPFLNQLNQLLVKCKLCSETNIQRGNFKEHAGKCSERQISCPAVDIQCDWVGRQDQVSNHVNNCSLMKVRPMINELNAQVKQQADQIHFLYTILEKVSKQNARACKELQYTARVVFCDICEQRLALNKGERALHFCPQKNVFDNKTTSYHSLNQPLMLKESKSTRKILVTTISTPNISSSTKIPRCGVRDGPLFYSAESQWGKKDFTWKLVNGYLPAFGAGRTRAILYESFNDWARYAPLTFREVSEYDKADFEISFVHRYHDPIRRFDGPGGTLGYAYLPPSGVIHFEAEEEWTEDYSENGFNLRLVATHEIGHALGLGHSNDPSSIMFERYQLMQPSQLLPIDDQRGIQTMYGPRPSPRRANPTSKRPITKRYNPITVRTTTRFKLSTTRRPMTTTRRPTTTTRRTTTVRRTTPAYKTTYRTAVTWKAPWYQPTTWSWSTRRYWPPWSRHNHQPTKKMRRRRPHHTQRRTKFQIPAVWRRRTRGYEPTTTTRKMRTFSTTKKTTVRKPRHMLRTTPQTRHTTLKRTPTTTAGYVWYKTMPDRTTRQPKKIPPNKERKRATKLPKVVVRMSVWPLHNIRSVMQPTRKIAISNKRVHQIVASPSKPKQTTKKTTLTYVKEVTRKPTPKKVIFTVTKPTTKTTLITAMFKISSGCDAKKSVKQCINVK
ncbi:unnamed protein product [Adineta ricciae]|uniref:RING-type domain-containing protein n=2 Tax=Adineta ricciae TaxID=249248 RepID=A0A813QZG3_ADIRI|nr:unnamed protein product [Adineta ricciae]